MGGGGVEAAACGRAIVTTDVPGCREVVRHGENGLLVPVRDGMLWDVGCGCGSIAIEWMRGAPEARAVGIEPQEKRRAMAEDNAVKLGAPKLQLVDGTAPEALAGLPAPDAVFVGGGVSRATIKACMAAL